MDICNESLRQNDYPKVVEALDNCVRWARKRMSDGPTSEAGLNGALLPVQMQDQYQPLAVAAVGPPGLTNAPNPPFAQYAPEQYGRYNNNVLTVVHTHYVMSAPTPTYGYYLPPPGLH